MGTRITFVWRVTLTTGTRITFVWRVTLTTGTRITFVWLDTRILIVVTSGGSDEISTRTLRPLLVGSVFVFMITAALTLRTQLSHGRGPTATGTGAPAT
jgi:hypothetical protein